MAVTSEEPTLALGELDAVGQAELLRGGEIAPDAAVELAIDRIQRLDPALGVLVTPMFEDGRRRIRQGLPDGPFTGVPILVKDFLCSTGGDPYYAGMKGLRDRHWRAPRTSHLAARLRAAGFVILGRTNTPELALMLTTEPEAFGPTRNPWNPRHSAGGSSGGSAAAVAARLVPVAHGNDGAGSIRVPASACGVVGLKPSRGRLSLGPDIGESLGLLAVEGPLTRSVRDSAALLDVMAGPMPGDPCVAPPPIRPFAQQAREQGRPLRIAVVREAPDGISPSPDCVAAVDQTAVLLRDLDHELEPVDPEFLSTAEIDEDLAVRNCANVAASLESWSVRTGTPIGERDVEPMTWELAERGRRHSAARLAGALAALQSHGRRTGRWFSAGYDLVLSPTMAKLPPALGVFAAGPDPMRPVELSRPFVAFTLPFNISGQPAISLPLYWNDAGLPIGVQLAARYGREDLLLSVAASLEAARPWGHHRPFPPSEQGEC